MPRGQGQNNDKTGLKKHEALQTNQNRKCAYSSVEAAGGARLTDESAHGPAVQLRQERRPSAFWYVPAGPMRSGRACAFKACRTKCCLHMRKRRQGIACNADGELGRAGAHAVHSKARSLLANLPAAHGLGRTEPLGQKLPALHVWQSLALALNSALE
eukprot:6212273-Pleurochrysis_carterae.AAC.3